MFKVKRDARKSLKAFFLQRILKLNILWNIFFLFAVEPDQILVKYIKYNNYSGLPVEM